MTAPETALVKAEPRLPAPPAPVIQDLIDAFLGRLGANSRRAYDADLRRFAGFLAETQLRRSRRRPKVTIAQALDHLVSLGPALGNWVMLRYREQMIGQGLQPATRNRRMSTIRSAMTLARQLGIVVWTLEVAGEKVTPYRDTMGPGEAACQAMIDAADARDRAILRLLHDLALRRGEVVSLDLDHLDLRRGRISILGKGRAEREWLTLPAETQAAVEAWLAERGAASGPLFISRSRAHPGSRLSGEALRLIVGRLGKRAGFGWVRPHGLRHTAITRALDLTDGDVRRVQKYSRHRSVQTVLIYDDGRRDEAGEVASMVAADDGEEISGGDRAPES